eukprot:2363718-Pleurochrysis_carterae.AAC.1
MIAIPMQLHRSVPQPKKRHARQNVAAANGPSSNAAINSASSNHGTDEEYAARVTSESEVQRVICSQHECYNYFDDGGVRRTCDHELWASGSPAQMVATLQRQRECFRALSRKTRKKVVRRH